MQLRILTLNIWGVRRIAKYIDERVKALIKYLKNKDSYYDIIGLQEVWSKQDYILIRDQLKSEYPYSHYFLSGVIGSGCCVLSKHPILNVYEHRYTLNGFPHKIQHGDWFCGKLIGLCIISCNGCIINVYNTHLHANYHHVIPDDIYLAHRVCQAYELIQFIESTSSNYKTDLVVLLGDLNLTTDDLGFKLIKHICQFHDSHDERIRTDKYDPDCPNNGYTCDLPDNPFATPLKHSKNGQRIDYILYHARNNNVKCIESYTTLNRIPNSRLCYSDHLAVYSLLEIDEKVKFQDIVSRQNNREQNDDVLDNETRDLLESAVLIIKATVERIQRDRLWYGIIALISLIFLFLFNGNPTTNSIYYSILMLIKNLLCLIVIIGGIWLVGLGKPHERNALSSVKNAMSIRLKAPQFFH
ncbi:unnamed protein product [Didymodactylos carnosus]|uniref:sphingomyelin phosphodiesterase n=1 Tax=Didymodactylos carnosus TaxID=1234261 RepID=A0A813XEY4_9BILA|nr:unnamed protein product [Didymodactylos carnosus]CAF0865933.1 unnamed protein product [Didymodactylos carnosus]CAF3625438.1 unnamed protein product [Didymodactylos carnosus]CAF3653435.1 unnamed protein product [Didymodactylos carnosus]